jgi:hypothetical protein
MQMYVAYHEALVDAVALVLDPDLKSFEQDFAPVPPPAQPPVWETILLTVLNLVGTIAVSSFFNSSMFLDNLSCLCLCTVCAPAKG